MTELYWARLPFLLMLLALVAYFAYTQLKER